MILEAYRGKIFYKNKQGYLRAKMYPIEYIHHIVVCEFFTGKEQI